MENLEKEPPSKKYKAQALNKRPNSNRNELWIVSRDLLLFGLFLFVIGIIVALTFILILGLDWLFANYLIVLYIFGYPSLLGALIVWVKAFKKENLRPFLLRGPKVPEKVNRWFFVVLCIGGVMLVVENMILMFLGVISYRVVGVDFWLLFIATVFGAGIVEEIFFRGYLYFRFQEVFGSNNQTFSWNREYYNEEEKDIKKKILSFKVQDAAIASSLIFALVHVQYYVIDPFFLIFVFALGLLLCKARNDWNSLVPGMIIHGAWNAYIMYESSIEINHTVLNKNPLLKEFIAIDLSIMVIVMFLFALIHKIIVNRRKIKKEK